MTTGIWLIVPYDPLDTVDIGRRVTLSVPEVTADAFTAIALDVTVVTLPYVSTVTTGTVAAAPNVPVVPVVVGNLVTLSTPLVIAVALIPILMFVTPVILPYVSTVTRGMVSAAPYAAAVTPDAGSLVASNVPEVTAEALIDVCEVEMLVMRPY